MKRLLSMLLCLLLCVSLLPVEALAGEPAEESEETEVVIETEDGEEDAEELPETPAVKTVVYRFAVDGRIVSEQTVKDGDALEKPADPSKGGFAFTGWFIGETQLFITDADGDGTVDPELVQVSEDSVDVTVTAVFTENAEVPAPAPAGDGAPDVPVIEEPDAEEPVEEPIEPAPEAAPKAWPRRAPSAAPAGAPDEGKGADDTPDLPVTRGITDSGTCGDNLTWTLYDDGRLVIEGTGAMTDFNYGGTPWEQYKSRIASISLPDGLTNICKGAFMSCGALTSVSIPASVTTIGWGAFNSCYSLANVTIPEGVTTIGDNAFFGCSSLTAMTLPASVRFVGGGIFSDCSSLPAITVADGNPYFCAVDGVLFSRDMTQLICWPTGKTADSYTVPDGVTWIYGNAFVGIGLKSVHLPDGLERIGFQAFCNCYALAELNLPETLTTIEADAFNGTALTSVTIPAGVTSIERDPFSSCPRLTAITVADGNPAYCSVGGVLFTKDMTTLIGYPSARPAESYQVPAGVTTIAEWSFCDCKALKSVTIPEGVAAVKEVAFCYCTAVETLILPASLTSIEWGAFSHCTALRDVYFGGTAAQWADLMDTGYSEDLGRATKHFALCTGGAAHVHGAPVREDANGGGYDEVVYCSVCHEELSREHHAGFSAPVLTEAFNSATGVRVSWLAVEDAVKYRLLRKDVTASINETQWKNMGETTELTLIDKTAKSSHRYTYTVVAIDANGTLSPYDATGRTCTYIAKADITELKAMEGGVSVTWSRPAGAKNFRVMRRVDGTAAWTVIAVVEGTSYVDTTAPKGVKVWYTVRGVSMDNKVLINSYNGTGWSIFHVAAPVLTEAFNSATGVRVSWRAVDGAAKYRLLRKNVTTGETDWTEIGVTTELTLIDTSAKSASRYTYTVQCIDANGRTSSAPASSTRTCTYIAMAKITSIGCVSNGVKLVWSKPAGAKMFRVMRRVDGTAAWTVIAVIEGTSYTDTNAPTGVKLWYTVRAVTMANDMCTNSYNGTGWSVTHLANPVISRVVSAAGSVVLNWSPVPGAENYAVLRKTNGGSWQKIASVKSASYTDKAVSSGTHYVYTICCLTADGAKYVSGYDEAGKEITFLASPTLSISSTASGKPRLSWTRVTGATEYYVYRSVNGSEFAYQYTTTNTYYTNVATYSGNTYGYYVVAVCGDGEYRSAASGAVSFAVK